MRCSSNRRHPGFVIQVITVPRTDVLQLFNPVNGTVVVFGSLLRDYLELDMQRDAEVRGAKSFRVDVEKVVDDFVLLCLLAGNDFLPGMLVLLCLASYHSLHACSLF